MSSSQEPVRVAIAGAASLRGKEVKECLAEANFLVGEVRLLDEEILAGTLTEAAGEPAVIETINEESFERVRFAFFTGSAGFTDKHAFEARHSGAVVIDLSGGTGGVSTEGATAKPWIPALDAVLPSPTPKVAAGKPQSFFSVPSTPAIVAISISAALAPLGLDQLVFTFFQPVSERGAEAIGELEDQVVKLLSFQPVSQAIFDVQIGFNMLWKYGPESSEKLSDARARIIEQVRSYLAGRIPMPAIALVQAPVFHTNTFTAYASFKAAPNLDEVAKRLEQAGVKINSADDEPPNNVNVAGEAHPVLGQPERDPGTENGVWLWGAADNLRVPAATSVAIAEKLVAS